MEESPLAKRIAFLMRYGWELDEATAQAHKEREPEPIPEPPPKKTRRKKQSAAHNFPGP